MSVLTTWQSPQQPSTQAGNAVSLTVDVGASGVVTLTRWINGIVFFTGKEYEDITISWPLSWTKQSG